MRLWLAPCAKTRRHCLDRAEARLSTLELHGTRLTFVQNEKRGKAATAELSSVQRVEVNADSYRPAN